MQQKYKPDIICYNKIIVELKAVKQTAPEHEAQLINYLKATDMKTPDCSVIANRRLSLSTKVACVSKNPEKKIQ